VVWLDEETRYASTPPTIGSGVICSSRDVQPVGVLPLNPCLLLEGLLPQVRLELEMTD
jgi:hypothetical protein